jgi:hypothetical protein
MGAAVGTRQAGVWNSGDGAASVIVAVRSRDRRVAGSGRVERAHGAARSRGTVAGAVRARVDGGPCVRDLAWCARLSCVGDVHACGETNNR